MNNLHAIIRAAELVAAGSSSEAINAAEKAYIQQKRALDKSRLTWSKLHQLQYTLYDLQLKMEETP